MLELFTYVELLVPLTSFKILCRVCSWLAPMDIECDSNFPCAHKDKNVTHTWLSKHVKWDPIQGY